jgi:RNA polymerase sigma factor (sigma-70 family)
MAPQDLASDPQSFLFRVAGNLIDEFELGQPSDSPVRRLWNTGRLPGITRNRDCTVDSAARQVRVREILNELSPLNRAALILHRRDGMTCDEIAAELGVPPSRVRQAIAAGLRHLCRQLRNFE